ncbi:MAG: hypothetical protein AAFR37_17530, partial [Cyanobacteria bacterium J06628_3]
IEVDLLFNVETKSTSISSTSANNNRNQVKRKIIEAQGWIVDSKGNIEFVAEVPGTIPKLIKISQANCQSFN